MLYETATCIECKEELSKEQMFHDMVDNRYICFECLEDFVFEDGSYMIKCEDCDNFFDREDIIYNDDEEYLCGECNYERGEVKALKKTKESMNINRRI